MNKFYDDVSGAFAHDDLRGLSESAAVYLIEEPTTGLYIVLGGDRARLTSRRDASSFPTRGAAYLASQQIADQPHELVRIDRV